MATKKKAKKKAAPKKAPAKKVQATDEEEGVRIRPDLENYVSGTSASGAATKNNGDFVAQTTDGFSVEELAGVCAALNAGGKKGADRDADDWVAHYAHLNYGQQVMCLRNVIRGVKTEEGEFDEVAISKACAAPRKAANARAKEAVKAKAAEAKAKAAAKKAAA